MGLFRKRRVVEVVGPPTVGDRIRTSGYGRTEHWSEACGRVVNVFEDGSVGVIWDGGWIEDQMEPIEITLEVD